MDEVKVSELKNAIKQWYYNTWRDEARKDSTGWSRLDRSNGMEQDIKRWEGIGQLDWIILKTDKSINRKI